MALSRSGTRRVSAILLLVCVGALASCRGSWPVPEAPDAPPCTETAAFGLAFGMRLERDDARIVARDVPGLGRGVPSLRHRLRLLESYAPFRTAIATLTPRGGRVAIVAATANFSDRDSANLQFANTRRQYEQLPGWRISQNLVAADGSVSMDIDNPRVLIHVMLDTRPAAVDPAEPPPPTGVRLRTVCSDRQMEARAFSEAMRALR